LVQRATEINWDKLMDIKSIGITAGASAPEILINEVIDALKERFEVKTNFVETATENVNFKVPRILRETL
jgi:4-hydroxy-3-methylbut-2-enyl diphosphate reductase